MTTRLATLRGQLRSLKRRRQLARWATGYSTPIVVALWTLVALFLLDLAFEMTVAQRIVALVAAGLVTLWALRRYTLPWLGRRETELDMALLVEKQQKIDSDLVAAIQFEGPEADAWGSPQLEGAVVEYVAEYGGAWATLEGYDRRQVVRRLSLLLATLALVSAAVALFPDHARVFWNRLLLGSQHYPTATSIDRLIVSTAPGQPVLDAAGDDLYFDAEPAGSCPVGQPLRFSVHASGEIPESGRVELTTLASGVRREIELLPTAGAEGAMFEGELDQVTESLTFQVFLGDAWTEPARLEVIARPIVDTILTPHAPDYAALDGAAEEGPVQARQIVVLEGARVDLAVKCVNKRLREAVATIAGKRYPLERQSGSHEVWALKADSPLQNVTQQLPFEIEVVDEDGLTLEEPLVGSVRIKADRKPNVIASLRTPNVLPGATPRLRFEASDDYGVAAIALRVEVIRHNGAAATSSASSPEPVVVYGPTGPGERPPRRLQNQVYSLKLAPYKLEKEDQVKLTLEVTDYRGGGPGQTSTSEALILNVTDTSGVLAGASQLDESAFRQTDAIIKRQTETGGLR